MITILLELWHYIRYRIYAKLNIISIDDDFVRVILSRCYLRITKETFNELTFNITYFDYFHSLSSIVRKCVTLVRWFRSFVAV